MRKERKRLMRATSFKGVLGRLAIGLPVGSETHRNADSGRQTQVKRKLAVQWLNMQAVQLGDITGSILTATVNPL